MKTKIISIFCIISFLVCINYNCIYALYENVIENEDTNANITETVTEESEIEEEEEGSQEDENNNNSVNTENNEIETENVIIGENNTTNNEVENSTESQNEVDNVDIVEENVIQSEENTEENDIQIISTLSTEVGTQTISDGIYTIATALDTTKVLDISGGLTTNMTNVQIWSENKVDQQKFKVEYLNNGYYKITSLKSSKVLDVENAGSTSGTNVWQYESNGSYAQQWIIKDAGDGYYYIISRCNNLYLDVNNAWASDGTNVQVYEGNSSKAQKFVFTLAEEFNGTQTISDGIYYISSALDESKVLDISGASSASGANLQIWSNVGESQQKFIVIYIGDGYYEIECLKTEKVIDVSNAARTSGTNVWQYESNSSSAQKWVIKDAGNGYYNIISRCGGLYLDVNNAEATNGTNVQIYEGNNSKAQQFKFEDAGIGGSQTIKDGTYYIASRLNTNKVLDVSAASTQSGANIQIWDNVEQKQQRFTITYLGNGFYKIQNVNSAKVLDVYNAASTSGTNVWQYESNGSKAQQWIIKESDEEGYYYIISRCNELYLDVNNACASNGTNIQMYEGNKSYAQKFQFINIDTNGIDVSVHNGSINWSEVASAGIDFTFIRAGYRGYGSGALMTDDNFRTNVSQALANGITTGVYFVTQAISYAEGQEEANYVLDLVKDYNITGPIAIDVEWAGGSSVNNGRADSLTASERTEVIKVFCETIENAGYTAVIYANKDWLINYMNIDELSGYQVWLAHYVDGAPEMTSDYTGNYLYWQYSSTGSVSGINSYVDLNIKY